MRLNGQSDLDYLRCDMCECVNATNVHGRSVDTVRDYGHTPVDAGAITFMNAMRELVEEWCDRRDEERTKSDHD
jgi:hypothetical protein